VDTNFEFLKGTEAGTSLLINLFDEVIYIAISPGMEEVRTDGCS
jgi:hypothetical protein